MLVTTKRQADAALLYLDKFDDISWDTEATGKDWRVDRTVSYQLQAGEKSFYFPFRHQRGPNLPASYMDRIVTDILHPDRLQTGHHLAFDIKIASWDGLKIPRNIRDSMLAAHLMNENEDSFKLKELAVKYVDPNADAADKALLEKLVAEFGGVEKGAKENLWRLSATVVQQYGEDDTWLARRLLQFYEPHLREWSLWDIFLEVNEFQLNLIRIELEGMPLSMSVLDQLDAQAVPKALELREAIAQQAQLDLDDPEFPANPRSHVQMKFWLGHVLNVPDTAKATLKRMEDDRCQLLLDFRVWDKLKGSFIEPYREKVMDDGRVRCNLYITSPGTRESTQDPVHGTVSDRVSSTDPNMQQTPPAAKVAFVAPDGMEFVEFDFSQAELRLAAWYYETQFSDPTLADILRAGKDMHTESAESFGIPRKMAKIRNFAIQYQAGAKRLAEMNNTNIADERRYLNHYHRMFPGNRRLNNYYTKVAEHHEYIRLWTGRTRRFNVPKAKSFKAGNNLIQGGIAQMLRRTLNRVAREIPEATMVLTVHDSILFLLPIGSDALISRIRTIMQDQPWCTMPMVVDVKRGPSWGDLHEIPRSIEGIPVISLRGVTDETLFPAGTVNPYLNLPG